MLTLSIGRRRSRASAHLTTSDMTTRDGMMRSVQRGIGDQLLSRRSSSITSRPETRRACPDRRTCVLLSARRTLCSPRHDRSQLVDVETTSCHFARLIVHSVGPRGRRLSAQRACGAQAYRLEVSSMWDGMDGRRTADIVKTNLLKSFPALPWVGPDRAPL